MHGMCCCVTGVRWRYLGCCYCICHTEVAALVSLPYCSATMHRPQTSMNTEQQEVESDNDEAVNEKHRQLHMFEDRPVAWKGFWNNCKQK